jgi:hypothetical protein
MGLLHQLLMVHGYGALWNDNWQEKSEVSHMDYYGFQAETQLCEADS